MVHDFESNDDDNSALSELSSNEDKEYLISTFPFDVLEEDERKERLKRKPRFRTQEELTIKRKDKEDDIRKKTKSSFHKILLTTINELLKLAGSIFTFESFPQNFITDITLQTNHEVMELTYEELFDYTHDKVVEENKYELRGYKEQANKVAEKKYEKNKKTLEYLKKNKEISEKSGWERIKNSKYVDLLKEYFNTDNFKKLVEKLSQKEDKAYMDSFKFFSDKYVEFFISYKPNEASSKKIKINTRMNSSINNTNIYQNSVFSDFTRSCSHNSNGLVNFLIPEEMNLSNDSDEDLADANSLRFDEIGNNIDNDNY